MNLLYLTRCFLPVIFCQGGFTPKVISTIPSSNE